MVFQYIIPAYTYSIILYWFSNHGVVVEIKTRCSLPRWFAKIPGLKDFDKYFQKTFGDDCALHDVAYIEQEMTRYEADKALFDAMYKKHRLLAILTFMYVRTLGWTYWYF